jgi:predicted nucleic acid-binding OB-fold protein
MKFYTVDVKNISSDTPRDKFSVVDLEKLADLIIDSGGLMRPLILKTTGLETFAVIDGHFEYYAAVRAREKNPRQCEMVNAFVIPPKNESLLSKQIALFKTFDSSGDINDSTSTQEKNLESSVSKEEIDLMTEQIKNLRTQLAQETQEKQNLYHQLLLLEGQIQKQSNPLQIFNDLKLIDLALKLRDTNFTDDKTVEKVVISIDEERQKRKFESLNDVVERVKIPSGKKQQKGISSDKMVRILNNWLSVETKPLEVFNESSLIDLALRLKIGGGYSENKANQIVEIINRERQKKKFESLNDVVERVKMPSGKRLIKGITSDKMVTILDTWSRIAFL